MKIWLRILLAFATFCIVPIICVPISISSNDFVYLEIGYTALCLIYVFILNARWASKSKTTFRKDKYGIKKEQSEIEELKEIYNRKVNTIILSSAAVLSAVTALIIFAINTYV